MSVYFSAAHEALVARGREEGREEARRELLGRLRALFLKTGDTYMIYESLISILEYSPEDAQALIQEWARELPD